MKPRLLLSLFLTILLVGILALDAGVNAENVAGPFKEGCPKYPVCLMNGVVLKTKYGAITAQRNMLFNRIDVNANGSIVLDLTGMVPTSEEILLFNAASFGNGTMPIQILGPAITAVSFGAAFTVQYSTQLVGGHGGIVSLTAGSNMTTALSLMINYTPFGGACTPFCVGGSIIIPTVLFIAALVLVVFLLFSARRVEEPKSKEPLEVELGREE